MVYDGSGNKASETDYAYDAGTLGSASGLPGHDDSNYPVSYTDRGNATSKTEWLKTGGTSPQWTYTYDQTGQMGSMIDPCGYTTVVI
jgi:YD repeat-containing protein